MNRDEAINKALDEYQQMEFDAKCWRELFAMAKTLKWLRPSMIEAAEKVAKNSAPYDTVRSE